MKLTFFFVLFMLICSLPALGQSKEALNLEISNLKAQVQTLDQKNQELVVKTATLQKDIEFLQRQIDELKAQHLANPSPPTPLTPASPAVQQAPPPPPAAVKTTGQFGRCRATTQKGTQCSRNAKSNGYCYQHGGV
jgi:septal ring factor EnvC (AmiA/AmiB activator)